VDVTGRGKNVSTVARGVRSLNMTASERKISAGVTGEINLSAGDA